MYNYIKLNFYTAGKWRCLIEDQENSTWRWLLIST